MPPKRSGGGKAKPPKPQSHTTEEAPTSSPASPPPAPRLTAAQKRREAKLASAAKAQAEQRAENDKALKENEKEEKKEKGKPKKGSVTGKKSGAPEPSMKEGGPAHEPKIETNVIPDSDEDDAPPSKRVKVESKKDDENDDDVIDIQKLSNKGNRVKEGTINLRSNIEKSTWNELKTPTLPTPKKRKKQMENDMPKLVGQMATLQGYVGDHASIMSVWSAWHGHETNIWMPQSMKDPQLDNERTAFTAAASSLITAHAHLQAAAGYEPYRERPIIKPTIATTTPTDMAGIAAAAANMTPEQLAQLFKTIEQMKAAATTTTTTTSSTDASKTGTSTCTSTDTTQSPLHLATSFKVVESPVKSTTQGTAVLPFLNPLLLQSIHPSSTQPSINIVVDPRPKPHASMSQP